MESKGQRTSPSIFDYLNYRNFLKNFTKALKESKQFNVRHFAIKAGIRSPGYLKMVVDGKRQLTVNTAQKFCTALDLQGKEKEYFITLVLYNQTTDPDLKKEFFDKLLTLRPRSSRYQSEKQHNLYISRPHNVTIREMVVLKDFKEDYKWIASRCFPPISSTQAKESVEMLLEIGLLKRDQNGRLFQAEAFIHTEDLQTELVEAYHFHEAMIDKARHALGQLPRNERNYYSLSLPLPKAMYDQIIKDFYDFRDRILDQAKQCLEEKENLDEVYQINFQLFPLTKQKKEP